MPAPAQTQPLIDILQGARRARRISQLELALQLGVSQRHVSFVESGRSRPSRELLHAWLLALDSPLALSNEALLSAGYAPVYSHGRLDDPSLAEADQALAQLLNAHEPAPALVLDAEWNLVRMNRGAVWLATTLLPWAADMIGQAPINMIDMMTHPQGLGQCVTNLDDVGPRLLAMLRQEVSAHRALAPRIQAYEAFLVSRLGAKGMAAALLRPKAPVLTTRLTSPFGELAFFSMFTTFGTPNDITLSSLRVEHMFPADDATRAVLGNIQ
jgi:transcriptional regulator with XRE-family HTH domain